MDKMISTKVLLISDDFETAKVWSFVLGQKGITAAITSPSDEDSTEHRLPDHLHDLILIDTHTQQMNVVSIIRRLRAETTVPIMLLLEDENESGVLDAYEAGADEVVVGAISPRLFQAKIGVWQRRSWTVPETLLDSFEAGDLRLDPSQRQLVKASGDPIKLTTLEFRLLHLLMSNPNHVMESSLIVARIWGANGGGDTTMLKNVVYRVRRKIEPDPSQPRYIQAIPGEGYLFVAVPLEKTHGFSIEV
jgi:DNA-binding response OmpR family regulator